MIKLPALFKLIPTFLPYLVCIAVGSAGTLYITKAVKPEIVVRCPDAPACNCPEQKPCNGIDFDKIKSRHLTIQNEQFLTIDGDSLVMDNIREALRLELQDFKAKRCR